jgi:hypothetical protein
MNKTYQFVFSFSNSLYATYTTLTSQHSGASLLNNHLYYANGLITPAQTLGNGTILFSIHFKHLSANNTPTHFKGQC